MSVWGRYRVWMGDTPGKRQAGRELRAVRRAGVAHAADVAAGRVAPDGPVVVRSYRSPAELEADAVRLVGWGFVPEGFTGGGDRFAPVQGLARGAVSGLALSAVGLPGVLGFLGSKKWRKGRPVTVTWVRRSLVEGGW